MTLAEKLTEIFNNEHNAYSTITQLVGNKTVEEIMPTMNQEKFVEVVSRLLKEEQDAKIDKVLDHQKSIRDGVIATMGKGKSKNTYVDDVRGNSKKLNEANLKISALEAVKNS